MKKDSGHSSYFIIARSDSGYLWFVIALTNKRSVSICYKDRPLPEASLESLEPESPRCAETSFWLWHSVGPPPPAGNGVPAGICRRHTGTVPVPRHESQWKAVVSKLETLRILWYLINFLLSCTILVLYPPIPCQFLLCSARSPQFVGDRMTQFSGGITLL